jgi:hypothetical protein
VSDLPIFDEAYFERRAARMQFEAIMRYMERFPDSLGRGDTAEKLREDFALGVIDFETFERRLDRALSQ